MTRRVAGALVGAVVLLAAVLVVYLGIRDTEEQPADEALPAEDLEVVAAGETGLPVALYFPDASGTLSVEERSLDPWSVPTEGARVLIEALLAGPTDEGLTAPLPEGTTLGVCHLTASARLYVDLVSTLHTRPPLTGSQMELLSVYSLVDSILLNVPEIDSVVLLWNGRQLETFAGHLDTSLPLRADRDLVRRRG